MLNIKAIDPAFRIADALIDHNLSVTPRPGSPLEVLYNNSIPTYLTEQELGLYMLGVKTQTPAELAAQG